MYYPQIPVEPENFAGRKELLDQVQATVQSIESGRPENVAICGIRGIGKTSLLFKLKEFVPDTCFLSYYAPSKMMNTREFVDALLQKMDLEYQKGLDKWLAKVKSQPEKIESFSVKEIAISLRERKKTPEIAFMEAMTKFIQRGFRGIILQIDEADFLSNKALAMMCNCVQELRFPSYKCPVSIIVSGRENPVKRLAGQQSPISRFFATNNHELKSLTKDEVVKALMLPVKNKKMKWSKEAIDLVYSLSNGYPFLVQLFGHYLILNADTKSVSKNNVNAAYSKVLGQVGAWYEGSWSKDPSPNEIKVLLALGSFGGRATFTEISCKTKDKGVGEMLKRLVRKGCLEKNEADNEYFLPHSVVADYLKIKYATHKN